MSKSHHDVNEVTGEFFKGVYGAERRELLSHFQQEIMASRNVKLLLSEIASEAMGQNLSPVNVLALGLNYGLALGVLMEQEKSQRSRRLAV